MSLWTSEAAAAATGGRVTAPWVADGVSIDTRTLRRGDLFVALTAARDGHDFVAQALEKGAAAALVSRIPDGVAPDAPLLVVPDVLAALEALGRAGRARTGARVVGVTGSVGKTSTKEMLRVILAGQGRVHASEASYNNHWGVPLTLARMPPDTDYAVIEIGMNHPGEIAPLARMARPHVALITTIAAAHLEAFGSLDGIAAEKASICDGLEPGGVAVLPLDLPQAPVLLAGTSGARVVSFGAHAARDWRLTRAQVAGDVTVAHAATPQGDLLFKVASPGQHFALNGLGALAAAMALGADAAIAAADLGRWRPPAGRGMRERILLDPVDEAQSFDLIDDAYNANPASMAASLDVLALAAPRDGVGRIVKGRRIAVLGDMLELGPDELALHAAVAGHPAMARVDLVHCAGPRAHALWQALPPARRGEWHAEAADLAARIRGLVDAGDVVLVKGSKGIRVSLVVDALRKLGQGQRGPEADGV
ncbi:MAG: UDP-N-acetylmuramoyl-tripeptide--D-alanyl-D-alanine ligase [Gemmobacter sp.]|nr:UDP-N-acetylmuramoyl-tripeptide--D-alanyl-D-alanine ligase [Gemmobacter sp.]